MGAFTILPFLLHPASKGQILLRSRSYRDPPRILPNYFDNPVDVKTLIYGIRVAIDLVHNSPSFRKIGAKLLTVPNPNCAGYHFNSDAYWECAMRHFTYNVYHDIGTCKMGDDAYSVVDDRLRVRGGISGLRVADASIMPTHTSGDSMAAIVAVGEKAADLIREDHGIPIP